MGPNTSVTQSEERFLVTQALWLDRHKTPRRFFLIFSKVLGFSEWHTSSGLTLQSFDTLAQKSNVSLSIIGLWPGKVISSFLKCILRGILFQKRTVSSQYITCCETKSTSSIFFLNFSRCCSATSLSPLAASPCLTSLCNPALLLNPVIRYTSTWCKNTASQDQYLY